MVLISLGEQFSNLILHHNHLEGLLEDDHCWPHPRVPNSGRGEGAETAFLLTHGDAEAVEEHYPHSLGLAVQGRPHDPLTAPQPK